MVFNLHMVEKRLHSNISKIAAKAKNEQVHKLIFIDIELNKIAY